MSASHHSAVADIVIVRPIHVHIGQNQTKNSARRAREMGPLRGRRALPHRQDAINEARDAR